MRRHLEGRSLAPDEPTGRHGCHTGAMGSSSQMSSVKLPVVDDEPCVSLVPIFSGLPRWQQMEVAQFARQLRVEAGDAVFRAGQVHARLYVVHEGQVKITRTSEAGRETIVRVLRPGGVAGELSFLTGGRPEDDAFAIDSARLCTFAHADLARLLGRFPDIGVAMLHALAVKLSSAERLLVAMASADVGARLAAYLLDCPTEWDARGNATVHLPITKKDVAAHLGTSPETVSRRLTEFERGGLVHVRGADVDILDVSALEKRAEGT